MGKTKCQFLFTAFDGVLPGDMPYENELNRECQSIMDRIYFNDYIRKYGSIAVDVTAYAQPFQHSTTYLRGHNHD